MAKTKTFEFRGVDNCYIAEVLEDSAENYTCSTPIKLDVQEVGKETESSSETHYYNNKPVIVINSEGADTLTLVVAPPDLETLAKIQGKQFDSDTGMMIDGVAENKYFALMYRTKGTDGAYRYCVRNKGTFSQPGESNKTEDSGTETSNTTLTYTGIFTEHEFKKGGKDGKPGAVKGLVVDERYGKADLTDFFTEVKTVDTVTKLEG